MGDESNRLASGAFNEFLNTLRNAVCEINLHWIPKRACSHTVEYCSFFEENGMGGFCEMSVGDDGFGGNFSAYRTRHGTGT